MHNFRLDFYYNLYKCIVNRGKDGIFKIYDISLMFFNETNIHETDYTLQLCFINLSKVVLYFQILIIDLVSWAYVISITLFFSFFFTFLQHIIQKYLLLYQILLV